MPIFSRFPLQCLIEQVALQTRESTLNESDTGIPRERGFHGSILPCDGQKNNEIRHVPGHSPRGDDRPYRAAAAGGTIATRVKGTAVNFVVEDTEATSADKHYGQIFQYAAKKTDEDFVVLDEYEVRSRLQPHIIPTPRALEVTHMDPWALDVGPSCYDMAVGIHRKLVDWGVTRKLGHNIFKFDHEIMRVLFYLHLLDPYVSIKNGSTRADTLTICQAIYTCDPAGLPTELTEKGNPSFRLEKLAPALGFKGHKAHDAMGDIDANIFLARSLRDGWPAIWQQMMDNGEKNKVLALVDGGKPVVAVRFFGRPTIHVAVKVAVHQTTIALFDLSYDPTPWLSLTAEQILKILQNRPDIEDDVDNGENADGEKLNRDPIVIIKSNGTPILFPFGAAHAPTPDRAIDEKELSRRIDLINQSPPFRDALSKALQMRQNSFPKRTELEERLYGAGFFPSRADEPRMSAFHNADDWTKRWAMTSSFEDERARMIARRVVYCTAPEAIPIEIRSAMERRLISSRILGPEDTKWTTIAKARKELVECHDPAVAAKIGQWLDFRESEARERLAELGVLAPKEVVTAG